MKEQGKIETPWLREWLQLFFRLSCWVAFPAIIDFIGKYLDKNSILNHGYFYLVSIFIHNINCHDYQNRT